MANYKFKYVCKSCKAVHWFLPADGICKKCGHKDLEKIQVEK